jgi:hypothetical protein
MSSSPAGRGAPTLAWTLSHTRVTVGVELEALSLETLYVLDLLVDLGFSLLDLNYYLAFSN